MNTIYAVMCEQRNSDMTHVSLCGLFRDKKKAEDAMIFWNAHAMPRCVYSINYITTDL